MGKHTTPGRAATAISLLACLGGCAEMKRDARQVPPPPVPTAANPCPVWTDFPANINENQDSPYLGCTLQWDVRAQLANPADLDKGRPLGPADGTAAAAAVDRYRLGTVKTGAGAGGFTPGGTGSSGGASGS